MKRTQQSMRRLWSSLLMAVLTLCGLAAPAAADQVPFTATGTAVITGVTHLPGGLTQLDGSLSGKPARRASAFGLSQASALGYVYTARWDGEKNWNIDRHSSLLHRRSRALQ